MNLFHFAESFLFIGEEEREREEKKSYFLLWWSIIFTEVHKYYHHHPLLVKWFINLVKGEWKKWCNKMLLEEDFVSLFCISHISHLITFEMHDILQRMRREREKNIIYMQNKYYAKICTSFSSTCEFYILLNAFFN